MELDHGGVFLYCHKSLPQLRMAPIKFSKINLIFTCWWGSWAWTVYFLGYGTNWVETITFGVGVILSFENNWRGRFHSLFVIRSTVCNHRRNSATSRWVFPSYYRWWCQICCRRRWICDTFQGNIFCHVNDSIRTGSVISRRWFIPAGLWRILPTTRPTCGWIWVTRLEIWTDRRDVWYYWCNTITAWWSKWRSWK